MDICAHARVRFRFIKTDIFSGLFSRMSLFASLLTILVDINNRIRMGKKVSGAQKRKKRKEKEKLALEMERLKLGPTKIVDRVGVAS